ncbi:MAG: transcription antitermination factor NusB [Cellulosilyticaceae bacterium]
MTRREARELIMKMLFEKSFQEDRNDEDMLEQYLTDVTGKVKEFVREEYLGIINKDEEINNIIESSSDNWSISRIAKVDLMLLKMAIYEIKWGKDIPSKVAINEAIEIAKIYSTDKSPHFINGVLGKIAQAIEGTNEEKDS